MNALDRFIAAHRVRERELAKLEEEPREDILVIREAARAASQYDGDVEVHIEYK